MKVEETEQALRKLLRTQGLTLKKLGARELLRIATDFWQSTSIEGLRPDKGDGLVAYFDLIDRGRGIRYEFGINRILRLPPHADASFMDWGEGYKLRFAIGIEAGFEVFELEQPNPMFDCWEKDRPEQFLRELEDSAAFQLVATSEQVWSNIDWSECGSPPGDPRHHSQELFWAKG